MNFESFCDSASMLASAFTLLLLSARWNVTPLRSDAKWMLLVMLALSTGVYYSSAVEWSTLTSATSQVEDFEDYVQVLIPALWVGFFYAFLQGLSEQQLREKEQHLRRVIHHMPVMMQAFDEKGNIVAWNAEAQAVTGYSDVDVVGKASILEALYPDSSYRESLKAECGAGGGDYQNWIREVNRKNGEKRYVAWSNISRRCQVPPWASWGIGIDVTERLRAEEDLLRMANHDTLTGLPNRMLLGDRIASVLATCRHNSQIGALLLLDLDNFKFVNDSLGHPMGDVLLRETAERLQRSFKVTDTVARFGGDEFVVVLTSIRRPEDADVVAARITQSLSQSFVIDGNEVHIGVSVGIALIPADGETEDELIKNADIAMYGAKSEGRNTHCFFRREMNAQVQRQQSLAKGLRATLASGEFALAYQPQVATDAPTFLGVEALLRWPRKEGGECSPSSFVPVAEQAGLMPQIGRWVIENACRQAQAWHNSEIAFPVAINLSSTQFRQRNLVADVLAIIEETGINPRQIEFEITESVLMYDIDAASRIMRRLADHGVRLAIDDFGTGYSSLSYLKRFPVQKLKIDQSFVRDIEHDTDSAAIVRAVIRLGQSMDMKIVAEGVETEGQVKILRDEGCDLIQGFYFSRPLAAEALIHWARSSGVAPVERYMM